MLRKRIIFSLIYANSFFHQSRNFRLQKVGNIRWLEKNYKFQETAFNLDELVVLNSSKNEKNIEEFSKDLSRLVDNVFIPIAAGGGIRTLEDAKILFDSGADKLVINSILIDDTVLVEKLVKQYGSQSLIASIDYKLVDNKPKIFIHNGSDSISLSLDEYIKHVESLGVGEIYLNSIDKDGTGFGYDFETIDHVSSNIPLIIAGGAGNEKHLIDGLVNEKIDAVATANLFNFVGNGLSNARKNIIKENLNIARWN